MGTTKLDMTGQRYGRLVVLSEQGKHPSSGVLWRCRCDCGSESVLPGRQLRRGRTRSCGCLAREASAKRLREQTFRHGMRGTRIHGIWSGMIQRTTNPRRSNYAYYGGRGIKVCERWRTFENFYADMGPTYADGLTLDRIDPDGDYCPENCRWANPIKQSQNRRNCAAIEWRGRSLVAAEWDRVLGLNRNTVGARLRRGWSVERALTEGVEPDRLPSA